MTSNTDDLDTGGNITEHYVVDIKGHLNLRPNLQDTNALNERYWRDVKTHGERPSRQCPFYFTSNGLSVKYEHQPLAAWLQYIIDQELTPRGVGVYGTLLIDELGGARRGIRADGAEISEFTFPSADAMLETISILRSDLDDREKVERLTESLGLAIDDQSVSL